MQYDRLKQKNTASTAQRNGETATAERNGGNRALLKRVESLA